MSDERLYISYCYPWPEIRTIDSDRLVASGQGANIEDVRLLVERWNSFEGTGVINSKTRAPDPSESSPGGFFQSREALDMGK